MGPIGAFGPRETVIVDDRFTRSAPNNDTNPACRTAGNLDKDVFPVMCPATFRPSSQLQRYHVDIAIHHFPSILSLLALDSRLDLVPEGKSLCLPSSPCRWILRPFPGLIPIAVNRPNPPLSHA